MHGVGETSIVPPLAAVANAVSNSGGVRMTHIPHVANAHSGGTGGGTGELMVEGTLCGLLGAAVGGKEKLEAPRGRAGTAHRRP